MESGSLFMYIDNHPLLINASTGIYLYINPHLKLSGCINICLLFSTYLFVYLLDKIFICLSAYLSNRLYLSIKTSLYSVLSIYLSIFVYAFFYGDQSRMHIFLCIFSSKSTAYSKTKKLLRLMIPVYC